MPRQAEPYHPLRGLAAPSPDGPSVSAAHHGRFTIEQSLQRDMTGLGLDHDEGSSWRGFHHFVLAAMA